MSHPVFESLQMHQLKTDTFDSEIRHHENKVTAVFFWGINCPNCEVAKKMLHQDYEQVKKMDIDWFHVNVYEDFELGTRFGLFGIPAFFFFKNGKKLGKISPFPGMEPFLEALNKIC